MNNKYKELIKEISDREMLYHLYATQVILIIISFVLGLILFDNLSSFLDLFIWKDIRVITIGGLAGILVVLLDVVLMRVLPSSYYDDGGLNVKIFRNRSILHIAFIAAVVATCEEILFRGVIQTHFGLVVTSVIFALVHYRYLFNWFLFVNITALSFFIGYIYLITENLVVTIFMHFIIDFLLGVTLSRTKKKDIFEQDGISNE